MVQALEPHRFTREEYERLAASGGLADLRVELLHGVIVEMAPEGPDHADMVQALTGLLAPVAAETRLRVGSPLAATDDSEPEPDLAIVAPPSASGHPRTSDLAIEVVVSRRAAARIKSSIYAAAGVTEYWIVDVPRRQVDGFTEPIGDRYTVQWTLRGDDVLTVPGWEIRVTVAELFARAGLD